KWLASNESELREEVDAWLPDEIDGDARDELLERLVKTTLEGIDYALDVKSGGSSYTGGGENAEPPAGEEGGDASAEEGTEGAVANGSGPTEDGGEQLSAQRARSNLLDRLLYKGVLPRYAFPTDVVSFHIFDEDRSTSFRPVFQYEPSQGLSV